jgi:serine/threonine-protein kinase
MLSTGRPPQNTDDLRYRYSLEHEIGTGSVSRVLRGYDMLLERPVAVKVMRKPDHDLQRRTFEYGAKISKDVSHPNIARTYELGDGRLDGQSTPYVVMEYVPGRTLQSLADERGCLSGEAVTIIGADIACGLSHAHSRGVVHRDIKPANILITPNNIAVLIDFTAKRDIGTAIVQERPLGPGHVRYASPEHLQQEVSVGAASDVYSLGATLYRLLAGRALFGGEPLQVAYKHLLYRPTPLNRLSHATQVSSRLDHIIMRSLKKAPHLRPSASEFAAVLIYEILQRYGWKGR